MPMLSWHNLYGLNDYNTRKIVAHERKLFRSQKVKCPQQLYFIISVTRLPVCICHTNLMSICQEKKNVTNSFPLSLSTTRYARFIAEQST